MSIMLKGQKLYCRHLQGFSIEQGVFSFILFGVQCLLLIGSLETSNLGSLPSFSCLCKPGGKLMCALQLIFMLQQLFAS